MEQRGLRMKSKEVAKQVVALMKEGKKDEFNTLIGEYIKYLAGQFKELAKIRNATRISAIKSIVLELDQRWRSMARRVNVEFKEHGDLINPNGYLDILKKQDPVTIDQILR